VSDLFETSTVTFPNELDIVICRNFAAPIGLVYEMFTKPEHVRETFATFGEEFPTCDIDLRVGGSYHYVLIPIDGNACSFTGTYLTIEPPRRTVATWAFDGWPGVRAIETVELREIPDGTVMSWTLSFDDLNGRERMTKTNGPEANFESIARYLQTMTTGK